MSIRSRISIRVKSLTLFAGAVCLSTLATIAHAVSSTSMDMVYEQRTGNDRVYVVNPDHDTVSVVDAVTGTRLDEIEVGDEPRSLALDGGGYLWVVNKNSSTISVINTATLNVDRTLPGPYGARPHGIVIDTNANLAYVVLEASGLVMQINTANYAVVNTTSVGRNPKTISINNDGSLIYLPRFITSPVAGESGLTVGNGAGEIVVLNTGTLSQRTTIYVPYNATANGQDSNTNSRGIPNYLLGMAISPTGATALVPAKIDNLQRGTMRDGQGREHNLLTRGILSRIDLGTGLQNGRVEFSNNSQPTAVAFGPNDNIAFAVHEGSRAFEAINVTTGAIRYQTTLGFAPTGLVVSPDGSRVYVHNWLDRSLSILNTYNIVNNLSNTAVVMNTVDLTSTEALSAQVLLGKQLFHDSADPRLSAQRYISCASCHAEGGQDGRVWDFSDVGEGLRNTADMRGRGDMEDGLVHWTGNFDEIQDFEHALREIFGGQGLMTDADFNATNVSIDPARMKTGRSASLDALVAFIDTFDNHGVSPFREQDGSLTAQGVRGRAVYNAASCATCHSGSNFTDSPLGGSHNIGTIDAQTGLRFGQPLTNGGLDTPTLQGLWNSAPYLHDGSALTVSDAIVAHTRNNPVPFTNFTDADLADLAAYVLQIDDNEPAPDTPIVDPPTPDTFGTRATIAIDGNMSDWPFDSFVLEDPMDASNGAENQLDYESIWMANDQDNLYIRYRNHEPHNTRLTWGYGQGINIDGTAATGFRPANGRIPIGVDYLIEEQSLYRYTGNGTSWAWAWVGRIPVQFNGRDAELSVARTMLGNPDTFQVFFYTDNNAIGGTAIDFIPDSTTNTSVALHTRYLTYQFAGNGPVPPPPPPPAEPLVYHNPATTTTIRIDGDASDWIAAGVDFFPDDPDDVDDQTNEIDFLQAGVAHLNNYFLFGWTNDGPTRLTWGNAIFIDTDLNRNTGFRGFNEYSPIGIDRLVERDRVYTYTGNGNSWAWRYTAQLSSGIARAAGNNVELAVPVQWLNNAVTIDLFFFGDSSAIGGTGLDFYPDNAAWPNTSLATRRFRYTRDPAQASSQNELEAAANLTTQD